jgi:hypothetical protein
MMIHSMTFTHGGYAVRHACARSRSVATPSFSDSACDNGQPMSCQLTNKQAHTAHTGAHSVDTVQHEVVLSFDRTSSTAACENAVISDTSNLFALMPNSITRRAYDLSIATILSSQLAVIRG